MANGGEEQQDAAAHRLPHAVHPAGRARLHRDLQGLRQTHEPHPLRLRRVPKDQAKELEAAGAGGEAGPGAGAAARRKPGLHDGGGAAPKRHWHCPRAPGRSSRRAWRRQSCRKRRPGGGTHAPGTCRPGRPCSWGRGALPAGDDPTESRDSGRSGGGSHSQHCRSPYSVCAWPRGSSSPHGQGHSTSRNDGAPSGHEAPHGSSDGHAPRPRLTDGHATSRDAAASPWHERPPSSWHAPPQALRQTSKEWKLCPLQLCVLIYSPQDAGVGWEIGCVYGFCFLTVMVPFLIKTRKFSFE